MTIILPNGGSRMSGPHYEPVLHEYAVQQCRTEGDAGASWTITNVWAESVKAAAAALPDDLHAVEITHRGDCLTCEPDACPEHRSGCPKGAHG